MVSTQPRCPPHTHTQIYIYIERERERARALHKHILHKTAEPTNFFFKQNVAMQKSAKYQAQFANTDKACIQSGNSHIPVTSLAYLLLTKTLTLSRHFSRNENFLNIKIITSSCTVPLVSLLNS